jgi:hypothetical protein
MMNQSQSDLSSARKKAPSREGNQSQSSTQDGFFRKTKGSFQQSKGETFGTIIQIIKTDMVQLQEMINNNTHLIKIFKLTSKSSNLSKKLTEIEETKDVKSIMERITEESQNIEKTGKIYNCRETTELIHKLTLELSYYELFIKKLNELFLLLQLKIGEESGFVDTLSKFGQIQIVLEKLIEKSSTSSTFYNENTGESNYNKIEISNNTNIITNDNSAIVNDYNKLMEILSINDLINYDKDDSKAINHFSSIFKEFLEKLSFNYQDLINKVKKRTNETPGKSQLTLDSFFTQKLLLERTFAEKDSEILSLKKELEMIKSDQTLSVNKNETLFNNELERLKAENKALMNEINKLKEGKETQSTKNTFITNENKSLNEEGGARDTDALLKIIHESI